MNQRILHHKDCAQASGIKEHGPLAACVDKDGHRLPRKEKPVTDELLTSLPPWGYSDTGMPIKDIAQLLHIRPKDLRIDPDGMPGNTETEDWLRAIARLKPFIPPQELEAVTVKGDDEHWRPEGPRIKVEYTDETGVEIEMAITVTDNVKPYYDADMALQKLSGLMSRVMTDVNTARNLWERDDA